MSAGVALLVVGAYLLIAGVWWVDSGGAAMACLRGARAQKLREDAATEEGDAEYSRQCREVYIRGAVTARRRQRASLIWPAYLLAAGIRRTRNVTSQRHQLEKEAGLR